MLIQAFKKQTCSFVFATGSLVKVWGNGEQVNALQ